LNGCTRHRDEQLAKIFGERFAMIATGMVDMRICVMLPRYPCVSRATCGLVLLVALRHSVSWAQFTIAIILVISGSFIWLAPSFGMSIDPSEFVTMLRSPTFLAVLVGGIIALRLGLAPYWIWSDERNARIMAETQVAKLSAERIPSKNTDNSALSIEFLRDNFHDVTETLPAVTVRRMLNISVLNRGNGWVSNCRLSVEQTAPYIYNNAVELENGFTLQAGERRCFRFLYLDERFPDGRAAPKVLLAHKTVGFYVEMGFPTAQPTVFTLKATSNEARESTSSFMAYVDGGHLRMESI
jgi:hypothetical protein